MTYKKQDQVGGNIRKSSGGLQNIIQNRPENRKESFPAYLCREKSKLKYNK